MPPRPLLLLALALLVATAGIAERSVRALGKVDASTESLVLEDDPDSIRYDRTGLLFSNDEFVLVGLTRDDLFTPAGVAAMSSLSRSLKAIEGVASVLSPVDAPLLRSFTRPRMPFLAARKPGHLGDEDVDLELARAELTGHELFAGNVISQDGRTAGFVVTLETTPESAAATRGWLERLDARARAREAAAAAPQDPAAQAALAEAEGALAAYRPEWVAAEDERKAARERIVRAVRDVLRDEQRAGADIAVSGVPSLVVDMVEAIERDLRTFSALSFLFVLGFLSLVFRRFEWVLLPLLTTTTVVIWTVFVMAWLGIRMTVITANVPSLLLVLSLAHSIHLVVGWRELAAEDPHEPTLLRVRRLTRRLVWPCLFTATTTMVGFLSLYYAGSRPIIDFGQAMATGVGLAFLFSFLLVPAGLQLVGQAGAAQAGPEGKPASGDGGAAGERLRRVGAGALRRRVPVLLAALALVGLGVVGISRIEVEARFIDYFRPGSPIRRGLLFIDERLGGTSGLEVVLTGPPGSFGALHPDELERTARTVAWLRARPQVGVVMSYTGLLDEMRKLFPQATRAMASMQAGTLLPREMQAPYVVLEPRQVGGREVGAYGATRIVARVRETDPGLDRNALLREVREYLAREYPPDSPVQAEVTGMFVLYANMLASLVGSQVWTSLIALGAILGMLSALYRSPSAGVLALIPNLIPIALVLGAMGFARIPLDMATVMIASVSLGIGVDCAIHYLFRFRSEWRRTGDLRTAVEASHASIGTSILWTSLTSVVGFSVLAGSEFLPNAYFGLLTGFAMIAALSGMLVLLPAMLAVWNPFRNELPREG